MSTTSCSSRVRSALRALILCLFLLSSSSLPLLSNDDQDDARRIVEKLGVAKGAVLGEIGAGTGEVALEVAEVLRKEGKLYANELDKQKLKTLRERASNSKGAPIDVVEALPDGSNFPDGCCDGLYMRDVYHHFTEPAKLAAQFYRNLKPGGRLVVIDFRPGTGTSRAMPEGVPENRAGHGIPLTILREELEAAGFQHVETIEQWRKHLFAVIVEKPK
jgi:ubiquinone/menaquinone biosynthesis C-methylase UbiE